MAFARKGKAKKAENTIEVIKPVEDKKVMASMEEKILCPICKKVIGTKIGNIYQILDKRLVSFKGTECPHCKGELK